MISHACPSSPNRAATGTVTSSKNTSWMSPSPISEGILRTVMPGVSIGTSRMVMPRLRSSLVRVSRKQVSASPAYEVQIFWPLIVIVAVVLQRRAGAQLARSEPASGSENPWHHSDLPSVIGTR